jgi:hypothetical protein
MVHLWSVDLHHHSPASTGTFAEWRHFAIHFCVIRLGFCFYFVYTTFCLTIKTKSVTYACKYICIWMPLWHNKLIRNYTYILKLYHAFSSLHADQIIYSWTLIFPCRWTTGMQIYSKLYSNYLYFSNIFLQELKTINT